ncbi:MAG: hypothetical protein HY240_07475 [Actinobacteria bacterium]|nr:hypothetical protein [Actinomycetota bacterium]
MFRKTRRLIPIVTLLVFAASLNAAAGGREATRPGRFTGSAHAGVPAERRTTPLRSDIPPGRLDRLHRQAEGTSRSVASRTSPRRSTATVGTSFAGVANMNPVASPSDSTGAAGPDFVMAAVNVHVQVFDRTGATQAGPFRLKSLFNNLPAGTDTDPKVVYDTYSDTFVLAYLLYNNHEDYIVIVTIPGATADKKSTWCPLVLNGDQIAGDGHQFADYPGLGFTADRVTITTNNFPFSGPGFDYVQILSFKKSKLYDCSLSTVPFTVLGGKQTRDPDGSKAFTIQPAETIGGSSPKVQYMASFDHSGSGPSHVVLWRLKFLNHNPRLARTAIGVGSVSIPPYGRQCGTTSIDTRWDTGDMRLINAYFDADTGFLYTAHAVSHVWAPAVNRQSAARWYEIRVVGNLYNSAIPRNGYVGGDGYDVAWPSVATNSAGVLFVNFTEGSSTLAAPGGVASTECLSLLATTVLPGQEADTGPVLVKEGEARYDFGTGVERWGDYSAINRDPLDGTQMVAFGAYAFNAGTIDATATTYLWNEWVASLSDV